jgi:hypothetical protein
LHCQRLGGIFSSLRNKVFILGGIVLLGLGFVLWRMTRDIDEVEAADPHPKAAVEPAHPKTDDSPAAPVAARDARIPQVATRTPAPQPLPSTTPAPAIEPPAAPVPDTMPPTSRAIKNQLRKQVDAIDGYVSDCVTRAAKSGSKVTGAAALTLKFEHWKQKTVVTEVAIEPIDTTIKDQALLECLRDTGKKMVIDMPEDVNVVTATHQVDLDAGAVTDHKLTALDVKHPGDPPPAP